MAREEADRENLLADATAYHQRIQWQLPAWREPVFVGFRKTGAISFYFGQDPVYHFNSGDELRRLYLNDRLLKAERGVLVRMQRIRSEQEVVLQSEKLSGTEQEAVCEEVWGQLQKLGQELAAGHALLQGQFPENAQIEAQVLNWLQQITSIRVADSAGLS